MKLEFTDVEDIERDNFQQVSDAEIELNSVIEKINNIVGMNKSKKQMSLLSDELGDSIENMQTSYEEYYIELDTLRRKMYGEIEEEF